MVDQGVTLQSRQFNRQRALIELKWGQSEIEVIELMLSVAIRESRPGKGRVARATQGKFCPSDRWLSSSVRVFGVNHDISWYFGLVF